MGMMAQAAQTERGWVSRQDMHVQALLAAVCQPVCQAAVSPHDPAWLQPSRHEMRRSKPCMR